MSPTLKRSSAGVFSAVAAATLPLVIALVVSELAAVLLTPADAAPQALELADKFGRTYFWTVVVATAIAGALVYLQAGRAVDGSLFDRLLELIAKRDLASVQREAQQQGLLGPAAESALRRIEQQQRAITSTGDEQLKTVEAIQSAAGGLRQAVSEQASASNEISRSANEILSAHKEIGENTESLSRSAEETSSSVLEMVAISNEVTENIHNLASSVEETTTAIEQMTFSVKEVAKNIEELSTATEETAASMNQMDVSISQVEGNANETARLSEAVSQSAEVGSKAIAQTITGIDRIKESSRIAGEAITSLGQKIDEIGNILTVIDEVAEQTNLLALNAAIIAAQAGEHGRGFAVVADEIKALAERTGASTKEIAELIKGVQGESKNAINTMSKGIEAVEEGVRLGHNAEDALGQIVASAQRSSVMIKAIAEATVEQAKGSKQVTSAISRIAETVQQIALATSEQAKGAEQIMKSAERMRVITQQVERSTEEQNRGGRQVTGAMENIREIVERIHRMQEEQVRNNERLVSATEQGRRSSVRALESAKELENLTGRASTQIEELQRHVA